MVSVQYARQAATFPGNYYSLQERIVYARRLIGYIREWGAT
jgi:hypothetical protein